MDRPTPAESDDELSMIPQHPESFDLRREDSTGRLSSFGFRISVFGFPLYFPPCRARFS
jgi:hypothetical protein